MTRKAKPVQEQAQEHNELYDFAKKLSNYFGDSEDNKMFTIGNLCGFFTNDPIGFLNKALRVSEKVNNYDFLLQGVYPLYFSTSHYESNYSTGYIDPQYCLTKWYTGKLPEDNIIFMCEVITYQLNTAAMTKRLANLINEVADHQNTEKKIGKALLYTSAALLNQFSDLVLENIDAVRNDINNENFYIRYLEKRELILNGTKAHMVPLMDEYFHNRNLVNTSYKRPLSKLKNLGYNTYDKAKEEKEKRRIRQFVLSLLKTMNDVKTQDYGGDLPF